MLECHLFRGSHPHVHRLEGKSLSIAACSAGQTSWHEILACLIITSDFLTGTISWKRSWDLCSYSVLWCTRTVDGKSWIQNETNHQNTSDRVISLRNVAARCLSQQGGFTPSSTLPCRHFIWDWYCRPKQPAITSFSASKFCRHQALSTNPGEVSPQVAFHSCVGPLLSLQVYVDVEDRNEWHECFDVGGVKLPTGLYFGASAVTGQLAGKCNSCTSAWLRILCLSSHTVASFQKPSFPMEFKYSWFSNPDISPFSWDSQFLDLDITEFVISGIPFQIHGSYFWSFLSATFTNINYPTTSMVLVVFWDHHSSSCNSNIKCLLHCISLPKLLNDNEIMFFSYGTCLLELKKEQNIVWMLFILQTTMT